MKTTLAVHTNLLLCSLLIVGFATVAAVNYSSNNEIFRMHIEHISELTSESVYHQINSYFTRPVSVSMTMANDSLLKHLLAEEKDRMDDASYIERLRGYLDAYKKQYSYDSVFLVSTRTNRYYHFNGLDRVLTRDNPENQWYYNFLDNPQEYALNVDNDEARNANQAITTFVNCKIYDDDGRIMGVVGVGLQVGNLHELLQSYKDTYGVRAVLIDDTGTAAISSEHEGGDLTAGLFDNFAYLNESNLDSVIAQISPENSAERKTLWIQGRHGDCFVVSQYVAAIQWRLIVESDASAIGGRFRNQLLRGIGIAALILLAVLVVVNKKDREKRLLQDSLTDPLTGLHNRRFVEESLKRCLKNLSRTGGKLSVLLIDVDCFKNFNDTYGHSQGDECLKEVAGVLHNAAQREGDVAARYGGEEFIVILPNTDEKGARIIAETLLRNMTACAIPHEESIAASCVTFSIGGVTGTVTCAHSMEEYIQAADAALYDSKAGGRNRYTGVML